MGCECGDDELEVEIRGCGDGESDDRFEYGEDWVSDISDVDIGEDGGDGV